MRMYDIIEKKRDGYSLTEAEIIYFVEGYTSGKIPDYQASALLMAIYFQGMTQMEAAQLTMAMVHSGETIDLSMIEGIKVDKHSTGGVGDTTTLILAPLVASTGAKVPKMSGRGLGHTGGTLDKLEAINGFEIDITKDRFIRLVNEHGLAVIGQTDNLAPADKMLYSLRDVTATVNSIPLIAASIMSKKIASGADAIVLDVKVGAGAFMKDEQDAIKLAEAMVNIGENVGKKTVAIISSMEQPLGNAIGNGLEVAEAIATLKGEGPADLTALSLALGSEMVVLAGMAKNREAAEKMLKDNVENGKALAYFEQFIKAQHGDATVIDQPAKLMRAPYQIQVRAKDTGYVTDILADEIGKVAMMLGAGRKTKDDIIDLHVGIILHKKIGEKVTKDDILCTVHSNEENPVTAIKNILNYIKIGKEVRDIPLIRNKIVAN